MKRAVSSTLRFVAITLALTWLWRHGGQEAYGDWLHRVASPLLDAIGADRVRIAPYRERYVNWIPFVGLVLATHGLPWTRRLAGLAIGLAAIAAGHVAVNFAAGSGRAAHLPLVPALISDALPCLLWIVIAWPAIGGWFEPRPAAEVPEREVVADRDGDA